MKKLNQLIWTLLIMFFTLTHTISPLMSKDFELSEKFMGDDTAKNILIEYASLSCVHCANFHNQKLPKIKKELIDSGMVKFIYRDFPLDRPAMIASMIAQCYQKDQYFVILNSMFKNQKKWVSVSDDQEKLKQAFYNILKVHGIKLIDISACIEENEVNKKKWESILKTRLDGQKMGVTSTPTFFLNGKKLEGNVDIKVLKDLIY